MQSRLETLYSRVHMMLGVCKSWPRAIVCLLGLILILCGMSCGGTVGTAPGTATTTSVALTISPTTTTLAPGKTVTFQAYVSGSTNQNVIWSASGGVITQTGIYTAPTANGTYTVTATSAASSTASAVAQVIVNSVTINPIAVQVTPPSTTVSYGTQVQFLANVTGTTNTAITWSVSDGTISSTGLFTAPSTTEQVTVLARSVANPSITGSSQVTITNSGPIISIAPFTTTVAAGATVQFTATIANSTNQNVNWNCTGGTITSTGLYTAGSATGTFQVTATDVANSSVQATATVQIVPITVTLSPLNTTVVTGQTEQFTATVRGATNPGITWSASAGSITQAGLFTAPATAQTVTITATSQQNGAYSASTSCYVVSQTNLFWNFEPNTNYTQWSGSSASQTPSGVYFYGPLSGTSAATLQLSDLSPNVSLTLDFSLFVIGGWTGLNGNPFTVTVDSTTDLSQSFSNTSGDNQSYPNGGSNAPGTSATATNSLGYSFTGLLYNDATYTIDLSSISHSASTVTVTFAANTAGTAEWGVTNVTLTANPGAKPPAKLVAKSATPAVSVHRTR